MPRRAKRPVDDEALVAEWLGEHPSVELQVTYLSIDRQWLVAAYLVGSRQIHGFAADYMAVHQHASLIAAMLATVNELEQSGEV